MKRPNQIVYILGAGRSGSTLIERILNSSPNIFSVGEISSLWRLPSDQTLCSCQQRIDVCEFWSGVLEASNIESADLARLKFLEHAVVRNKAAILHRLGLGRKDHDSLRAEFNDYQGRLFAAVHEASGAEFIVDSSKSGPRLWVLKERFNIDVLHIRRRPRDVIASWLTPKFEKATDSLMPRKSVAVAAIDWIKAEQTAKTLGWAESVNRLDYEDFCERPRASLGVLGDRIVNSVAWVSDRAVQPSEFAVISTIYR